MKDLNSNMNMKQATPCLVKEENKIVTLQDFLEYKFIKLGNTLFYTEYNMIGEALTLYSLVLITPNDKLCVGDKFKWYVLPLDEQWLITITQDHIDKYSIDNECYLSSEGTKVIATHKQIPSEYLIQFLNEYNKNEIKDVVVKHTSELIVEIHPVINTTVQDLCEKPLPTEKQIPPLNKNNRMNKEVNGKREGYWEEYYDNGKLMYKGNYKDGKLCGYWEYYFSSGKIYFKGSHKDGIRDSYWERYYSNGKLMHKGNYKDGKLCGYWEYFYEDEPPSHQTFYY